jgi:cytochrome P450
VRFITLLTESHRAATDTTLPVGGGPNGTKPIAVRKGQTIALAIYATNRIESIWGPDVEYFRPERFENRKLDWSFIP